MAEEIKQKTIEELRAELTEKERLFCHQYIIDWNGARSARDAGYSEDTAKQIAYENLTKPYLKQYIDLIKNNFEEESGISKLRNLQELAKIAYSNISHLHDNWTELSFWDQILENNPSAMCAVESIDTKTETRRVKIRDGDDEQDIEVKYVKVKLYSKQAAIDSINKMLGYNLPEKRELTGKNGESLLPQTIIVRDQETKTDLEKLG